MDQPGKVIISHFLATRFREVKYFLAYGHSYMDSAGLPVKSVLYIFIIYKYLQL